MISLYRSPDGERIASGGCDQRVRVWDAETGKELLVLPGHDPTVSSVAFSADGRWVISGGHDNAVKVWDSTTTERLDMFQAEDGGRQLVRLVTERLGVGTAARADANGRIRLSGTEADYFRLLADATGAKAIQGRYLTEADVKSTAAVVVIDEHLAEQLFQHKSAVGETITIGSQDFTVVGVLSYARRSYIGDVKRDAFIPFGVFDRERLELDEASAAELDRIWVKVDSLDQVSATQKVIRNFLGQRHPDTESVVR